MGIAAVLELMLSEWGVRPREVLDGWTMSEVLVYLEAMKVRVQKSNETGDKKGMEQPGSLKMSERAKEMIKRGEERKGVPKSGNGVYVKVG